MNEHRNITLKQDPATGEPVARRLKRLADELAELLVDDQKGQVFLQIYPAGHEKGVVLRAIASPTLVIPMNEFQGSSRPGLADFREVAENLRDLEDDVHDLARAVTVLDDYVGLALDRCRWDDGDEVTYRLNPETVENLLFLAADARRRAEYFRDCFVDAAIYPFTADGAQAAEVDGEVRP
ncbi:hypothetical protein [Ciceribacter sp. RN22]|uniref:hypothetical protein n=1 Tax=Ciceribacter sp. RN22 TaxID=2954932 RepID=UPI002092D9C4|nr:hypothetical protein [Ciceribacter sp. RN22]MCO6178829.1 hypothetical protein [Ciceribacter sp. RN22]